MGETGTMAVGLMLSAVVAGLSSGLLGLGGGIVLVPAIFIALREFGVLPGVAVPLAIGTALAAMLPTALSLLQNYAKNKEVEWAVFRHRAWLYALAGAIGAGVIVLAPPAAVVICFAVLALAVLIWLFVGRESWQLRVEPFGGVIGWLIHAVIGLLASFTGLGAAVMTTPYLSLSGQPKAKAAALGMAYEAVLCAAAAIVLIGTGLYFSLVLPENSFGFVNYAAFAVAAPVCFLVATFTAPYASATRHGAMRKVFAVFILLSLYKMLDGAMPLFSGL